MDEKRKGEIAFILLKHWPKENNFGLVPENELENISAMTDIPKEELEEFRRIILVEQYRKENPRETEFFAALWPKKQS